jgi:hypothetical protein
MSVQLPAALEWLLGLLGVEWPAIDEDTLREVAAQVRAFAACLRDVRGSTDAMLRSLGGTYAGASYDAMIAGWSGRASEHIEPIVECCDAFAKSLETAADGVVAAKSALIAELAVAATEFASAQAAAVATFGLGEAAEMAVVQAGRVAVQQVLYRLEDEVISVLARDAAGPITGLLCGRSAA